MTMVEVPQTTLEELQRKLAALEAQVNAGPISRPPAEGSLDALADEYARQAVPQMDVHPRSFPTGYMEGSSLHQKRLLKLAERAKLLGGVRPVETQYESIYGHRPTVATKRGCPALRPGGKCDGNCWTPDMEKREMIALGLAFEGEAPPPLDPPEAPGSQHPNVPTVGSERKRLGGRAPTT